MAYPERLKTASYESPSGKVMGFDYVDVSQEIKHRVGSFEFSRVDGTLHQDKGVSGKLFPWTIYIHGQDYDLAADTFSDMLSETGPGYLNHPRWGRLRIQVLSAIHNEKLTQQAGQAVFSIQIQETLEREFPKTSTASQQQVETLADTAQEESISNFEDQLDVTELEEQLSQEQEIIDSANNVSDALSSVVSTVSDTANEFNEIISTVINTANDLVQDAFSYATQITSAIRLVAEIPGRISSRVDGLNNLLAVLELRDLIDSSVSSKNAVLTDELIGTIAVSTLSECVNQAINNTSTISRDSKGKATITVPDSETGYSTRGEVLAAVISIQDSSSDLITYLDSAQLFFEDNVLAESYIQTVQSYTPMWLTASTVIKAGLDLSFSLPVKRVTTLIRPRTILDLCYEFYKNIDDTTLDYFISTNSLYGDDIYEVPRGREVVYYE